MNTLRKLSGLVALSALVLVALMLSAHSASAEQPESPSFNPQYYYYGFDTTVNPWVPVFNGATKQPGLALTRSPEANGCAPLHEGAGYANLSMFNIMPALDGGHPLPIGTWMVASFPANGASMVTVDYAATSIKNCDGCLAMAYIGATPPGMKDFAFQTSTLAAKWQQYKYEKGVLASGTVYIALGFANSNASIGVDCINIKIDSLPRPWTEGAAAADAAPSTK